MAAGVIFMQWESYSGARDRSSFFSETPLTFNTRQERLHRLAVGDRLWIISRCPEDGQYYFVGALLIAQLSRNSPESEKGRVFGEYAIVADRSRSHDLGRRFPAEGLLRAFTFEPDRPIRYGSSIGQALQTLRLLDPSDKEVLNGTLDRVLESAAVPHTSPCGIWTKCDRVFADYFVKNWTQRREALAFLLYDPPPSIRAGCPVFIHSDRELRLLARFRAGQFVAGYKVTVEMQERIAERERVWQGHRANTIDPPAKEDFDRFWEAQNGVRGLFLMDEVVELGQQATFKLYGRALEWGFPMGVGYRYLTLPETLLLLRLAALPPELNAVYVRDVLQTGAR